MNPREPNVGGMKLMEKTLEQIAADAAEIFGVAYAPGARPRKLMDANKQNASIVWNENEDERRFDQYLDDQLDAAEKAIEKLTEK